ncbi:MAG: hypothetical protein UZ20_WS6002000576 [candidate division WS6 bacterium OLB21]|uniref:LamG-like jellyroll fold domain-containing protein n=1 Tax=candidate division WS6 bacterium OLB21 TaxID=1617427 RepID=A0A136KIU3_9BACT|nr:MAG: hypothetical protein UZ20_WS6002000576 [candidate division WS6 bacterium OLB21]
MVNNRGNDFPDIDNNLRVIGTNNSGCTIECTILAVNGDPSSEQQYVINSASDFNLGSYTNTEYILSNSMLELNSVGKTIGNGIYDSAIIDSGKPSSWESVTITPNDKYNFALPDNQQSVNTGAAGVIDMSGNFLLLHLDDIGSTITDTSGNNNNGTSVNTSQVLGQFANARRFNGTSSYIEIGNSANLNPTTEITIETWIKWNINPASGAQWAQIINKNVDNQYQIQHNYNNSTFEFAIRTNVNRRYVLGTTVPQQGIWYHVVGTYNGSSMRIYVNGNLENTISLTGTIQSSTTPLRIGSRTSGDRFFNGDIDEVAIYNRALTGTEISSRYNSGKAKLLMQVRACEQSDCSDAGFSGPDGTLGSFYNTEQNNIIVLNSQYFGRYFQYKIVMETGSSNFSPRINALAITAKSLSLSSAITNDQCVDLSPLTQSGELIIIPYDPSTGSESNTHYAVRRVNGITQLYACTSEDGVLIMNSFR